MRFTPTALPDCVLIDIEPHSDARGFFARVFCRDEMARAGLPGEFVQHSLSYNVRRGTLRGMHFQRPPHEEPKLVRCLRGAIHDVVIDLRPGSPTRGRWIAVELTADNRRTLYVPPGFAHGFQTLTEETEILYQMAVPYQADSGAGVRWNDPAFAIPWPITPPFLSERDAGWPDWQS